MSSVIDKNHFKTVIQVTVEITHQFPGSGQAEAMILNALAFPAVTRISVNHADTEEVIVKKSK